MYDNIILFPFVDANNLIRVIEICFLPQFGSHKNIFLQREIKHSFDIKGKGKSACLGQR
jgi:hypothetical protein